MTWTSRERGNYFRVYRNKLIREGRCPRCRKKNNSPSTLICLQCKKKRQDENAIYYRNRLLNKKIRAKKDST